MQYIFISWLTILNLLSVIAAKGQSAEDIVHKYIDAIGGKEKVGSIEDIYMKGSIEFVDFPLNNKGPVSIIQVKNKGYLLDMGNEAPKIAECFTENGGWFINTLLSKMDAEALPNNKNGRGELVIGEVLTQHLDMGGKLELLNRENFEGVDAYQLKLVTKEGAEYTYLIDPNSYLIIKMTTRLGYNVSGFPIETITKFNDYDYQKVENDYVVPMAWTTEYIYKEGKQTVNFRIDKVEVNKGIDESVFKKSK